MIKKTMVDTMIVPGRFAMPCSSKILALYSIIFLVVCQLLTLFARDGVLLESDSSPWTTIKLR